MVRILAWQLLRTSDTPLRDVDRACDEAGFDGRDRGLVRKLIAVEVRRRGTLRAIVQAYATGKPSSDLCAHVHLGLVQLLFLDQIPDHAAVSETVGAVHRTLGPSKVKYVNAILRSVGRERVAGLSGDPRRDLVGRDFHLSRDIFREPNKHPLLYAEDALSMPVPIFKRWLKRHGEEKARELALLAMDESPLSARLTGGDMEAINAEFDELGIDRSPGKHKDVLLFDSMSTAAVIHSKAFTEGRLTIQGECALRAAELLEAKEGERILDLCAAPGGKTAVLASSGANVLACDVDKPRLDRIQNGLERLSLTDNVELRVSNGTNGVTEEDFDGVMIDAPCSNTGVLAARPEARWRYGPQAKRILIALQDRLLDEGAAKVRVGGRLVYSTCSLEADENSQRIKSFLERAPGFSIDKEQDFIAASAANGGPVDGGYSVRLVRNE